MARFTNPPAGGGGNGGDTFDILYTTHNSDGTNIKVGDDAWIGDVDEGNQFAVIGVQDSSRGGIIFGDGLANKIYTDGTNLKIEAGIGDMNLYMDGALYVGDSNPNTRVVLQQDLAGLGGGSGAILQSKVLTAAVTGDNYGQTLNAGISSECSTQATFSGSLGSITKQSSTSFIRVLIPFRFSYNANVQLTSSDYTEDVTATYKNASSMYVSFNRGGYTAQTYAPFDLTQVMSGNYSTSHTTFLELNDYKNIAAGTTVAYDLDVNANIHMKKVGGTNNSNKMFASLVFSNYLDPQNNGTSSLNNAKVIIQEIETTF